MTTFEGPINTNTKA